MSEQSNNRFTVVLIGWAKYPEYEPEVKQLTERIQRDKDYIILSEPIELKFTIRSPEDILQSRMGKLQEIKADIVNEFGKEISEINNTIAKFQSLSYEASPIVLHEDSPAAAPCEDVLTSSSRKLSEPKGGVKYTDGDDLPF